jgi:hypothetical protein
LALSAGGKAHQSQVLPGYWCDRLAVNTEAAIFHQLEQLEASGSIENLRISAGQADTTAGPLVYCLESVENREVDLFSIQIDPASLAEQFDPDLLGGT